MPALILCQLLTRVLARTHAIPAAVFHMMIFFIMLGHWFGLLWYLSFMRPLELETIADLDNRVIEMGGSLNLTGGNNNISRADAALGHEHDPKGMSTDEFGLGEWYWIISKYVPGPDGKPITTWHIRWICSLYWALYTRRGSTPPS